MLLSTPSFHTVLISECPLCCQQGLKEPLVFACCCLDTIVLYIYVTLGTRAPAGLTATMVTCSPSEPSKAHTCRVGLNSSINTGNFVFLPSPARSQITNSDVSDTGVYGHGYPLKNSVNSAQKTLHQSAGQHTIGSHTASATKHVAGKRFGGACLSKGAEDHGRTVFKQTP